MVLSKRPGKESDKNVNFDEEQRAKIGKFAVKDGVGRATKRFMTELGVKVSESMKRSTRDNILDQ